MKPKFLTVEIGPTGCRPDPTQYILSCDFDRASSLICGNKMPTRCNRGFIADIIVCSTCFGHHYAHHQELKSIIRWLLPVVFGAVVFKLLQHPANRTHNSQLHTRPATLKPQHEIPQAATTV